MRKPLNRNDFRSRPAEPAAEPMLMRRRRFRYDQILPPEPSWSESADDFESDAQEFDMDVSGAGAVGGAAPVRPVHLSPTQGVEGAQSHGIEAPQDEVQISSAARALSQMEAGSQIHEARLAEIRAAIADGSYESLDKLDAAVDRLIEALRSEQR